MKALGPNSLRLFVELDGEDVPVDAGGGVVTIGFAPVIFFLPRTRLQACTLNLPCESKIPDGSLLPIIDEIEPASAAQVRDAAWAVLRSSCFVEALASPIVEVSERCSSVTCSMRSCLSLSAC